MANSSECNATALLSAEAGQIRSGNLPLGIVMALGAGFALAASMVTQRYALAYPESLVPVLCLRVPRWLLWLGGLGLYVVANTLKVAAFNLGPLSVLSSVFMTLLIWNLALSRLLLREAVDLPKVAGSAIVFVGAVTCTVGSPSDVPTQFSPDEFLALILAPLGCLLFLLFFALISTSICAIVWLEQAYPVTQAVRAAAASGVFKRSPTCDALASEGAGSSSARVKGATHKPAPPCGSATRAACDGVASAGAPQRREEEAHAAKAAEAADASLAGVQNVSVLPLPPLWLERIMAVAYPASLGIDEAFADLLIKGWSSMLLVCNSKCASCERWDVVYSTMVLWVFVAHISSLWWMPVVFRRFETTVALPIEYGAVNAASVMSGLLFYNEARYMAAWQVALQLIGCVLILLGIVVGRSRASAFRCDIL
ncbi:hypothetical protein AB1Y20_010533 [Prymnesium parvum]|uniref:EamA domain-containing protein n=1 Tax=Prymnesium parvum TaxID=97485 RepID=A0AB34IRD0_PRYPA